MALFKILRGESSSFTTDLQSINVYPEFHDGYCYFTADTGLFYIDYDDGSETRLVPFSGEDVGYLLTEGKAYYLRRDDGTYIRYTGDYNLLVEYDSPDSMPYFYYKTDGKHRIPLNTAQALAVKEINKGLEQKFWRGTKAEYKALDVKDEDTMYIVIDEEGGSIKADWNQNDESAPDYVKNRPGGYYENTYSTVLEEMTLEFEPYAGGNGYYTFIDDYNVVEKLFGSKPTVKVTFDGVIYEKAFDKYSGFYSDETIPFGFYVQIADGAHLQIDTTLEGDTHTVKIEKVEKLPVTISEKFLPDTVATKADIEAAIGTAIGGSY